MDELRVSSLLQPVFSYQMAGSWRALQVDTIDVHGYNKCNWATVEAAKSSIRLLSFYQRCATQIIDPLNEAQRH